MNREVITGVDDKARARALDITRSFIVQAPAGSGKTELLTQRFLKLLATVDRPERLLAITFTRKATQEMRHRILHRLRQAATNEAPESEHEAVSIVLAAQALQQDTAAGWQLLQNPGRLRVLTIDGLCAQFLARDPRLGGVGAGLAVLEIAEPLYREAIESLFAELANIADSGEDWSEARRALSRVLYLLDGDAQQLRQLLVNKLQARDQWVDRIGMDADSMEVVIRERQEAEFQRFAKALGAGTYADIAQQIAELGLHCEGESAPARFAEQYQLPGELLSGGDAAADVLQAWLFCRVLVTSTGALRKPGGLSRSLFKGLPKGADLDAKLAEVRTTFEAWSNDDAAGQAIQRMAKAPPLELGEGTAGLQQDITLVLAHALARLRVLFHERGECDFHYMTELALQSLGDEDSPGSLLLAEDARIEHILMDEFQDTSNTQFKLLNRLTSGWSGKSGPEGDGRSLFLVGDPMQSIYRFRQANVGLFIDVVKNGRLGNVLLKPLQLQANFRSREEIVDWINQQFTGIFPSQDERDSGAVRYARAAAARSEGGSVVLHALPPQTTYEAEARQVVQLVQQARAELGDPSIGILGRARKHLAEIARTLQQAGIAAQAVNIDELQDRPVVGDLMALTRALSHPGDRIAWLAILRAPWAGLTVAELHQIVGNLAGRDILSCIQEAAVQTRDSALAERLVRIAQVMSLAESRRAEDSLRNRVEAAWLGLGGPWCYASAVELDHARTFLDLLDELERAGSENLETRLSQSLQQLYAASPGSRVQLMTIHQAKGLEFDVVIVPGMARKPRSDDKVLVALQEFHNEDGMDTSLLAPLPPRIRPPASLYDYLRAVEVERNAFEQQRLLYVACTRARQKLHLLGIYSESEKEGPYAARGSLMEMLFPAFARVIQNPVGEGQVSESLIEDLASEDGESGYAAPQAFPLLQLQGAPLLPLQLVAARACDPTTQALALPELSTRRSVAFGEAVHEWLELIHDHWQHGWNAEWFEQHSHALESSLRRAGLNAAEAKAELPELKRILIQVVSSEPGRSIVSPEGKLQSFSELALLRREGNHISRHIIDRAERTAEGDWIITDYKSGTSELPANEQWREQLIRYSELLAALFPGSGSTMQIFQTSQKRVIPMLELESAGGPGGGPERS